MSAGFLSVDGLERQARALAAAQSPSEVFRGLLEGARLATPRAAIFLVRKNGIKGWGSVGYEPEVARRQRAYGAGSGTGWLGRLAASHDVTMQRREGGGLDPEFGQPAAADAVALPIRVKGRSIALLLAERASAEEPWFPGVLATLVHVARLRLDLDLALRKLQSVSGGRPAAPAASPPAAAPVAAPAAAVADAHALSPLEESAPAAPAASAAPAAGPAAAADPQLDAARRFARLVATDIRLYNEEAVMSGRRDGDLARRLAEPLARGRETFRGRFADLGETGRALLQAALVEVLAGGDASLLPDPKSAPAGQGRGG
jgi:hypothetical protein